MDNDILYGALCYNNSYNLGDNIQTLAATQYLPKVDIWIDRDTNELFDFQGNLLSDELFDDLFIDKGFKIKIIYNGWFDGQYCKFPPPIYVIPLFISFHVNETNHKVDNKYDVLDKYKIKFKS